LGFNFIQLVTDICVTLTDRNGILVQLLIFSFILEEQCYLCRISFRYKCAYCVCI